jgi:hypothetical protein
MPPLKHRIGARFGRLAIIARNGYEITCLCDCGKEKRVHLANLTNGHVRSCGCLRVETTAAKTFRHGAARRGNKTPTYECWNGMIKRCFNTKSKDYPNYGGRGITVCEQWMSFENFLADMGEKPRGLFIERKENDKGYSPDNCVWATRTEQNRNTRATRWLTHGGRTQSLAAWAEESGIRPGTISGRLARGMDMESALLK